MLTTEEAETRIRLVTKAEFLKRTPKPVIDEQIRRIIKEALKHIEIPRLRDAAKISLWMFYDKQYQTWKRMNVYLLVALLLYMQSNGTKLEPKQSALVGTIKKEPRFQKIYGGADLGQPTNRYHVAYTKDVKKVLDKLCEQRAMDPGDVSGRNSLRNRAEMEVRYQDHNDNIMSLKNAGTKLVIASAHADCSPRCKPWQGRVYSLDHTSGVTSDNRRYVPLETATDVYYTTKAGITYKNGLLGFNCRHYLVPYKKGFEFPEETPKKTKEEYAITKRQRWYERTVREHKVRAMMYKNVDKAKYELSKRAAERTEDEYIKYSEKNNRPYYNTRTKLI